MNLEDRLAIFEAQVANVRALKIAIRHIRREINAALRKSDLAAERSLTKLYAIMFCALAEANFSKVIHTPYGLAIDEIAQIQIAKANGVAVGWRKAVELGLRHLPAQRGSFQPNAKLKLDRAIDAYVFDQSVLRNKLAHGQWVVALNKTNDKVQQDLTVLLQKLTIVQIDGWATCHNRLAELVEMLIESPKKAFLKDWHVVVTDLEAEMESASKRTLEDHLQILKRKK